MSNFVQYNTSDPNLKVFIRNLKKDGKIILQAYATDATGNRVGKQLFWTRTVRLGENISTVIEWLINDICADVLPAAPKTAATPTGVIAALFEKAVGEGGFILATWGSSTREKAFAHFKRNFIPFFEKLGHIPQQEDVGAYIEFLKKKAMKDARSSHHEDLVKRSVTDQVYRDFLICNELCDLFPKAGLKKLNLGEYAGKSPVAREQPKSLPRKVRSLAYRKLLKLIKTPRGGMALALLFMLMCGLRTAEATALQIQSVTWYDDCGVAAVLVQEKNGTLSEILKTGSSYRCVVIPLELKKAWDKRMAYLTAQGVTKEELPLLSIGCKEKDVRCLQFSREVSALGRKILDECRCSKAFFQDLVTLMNQEPDYDADGVQMTDPTAYIFRRDFATRCSMVSGMPPAMVDYLLGHKNDANRHKDYLNSDIRSQMAQMLNRYVFDRTVSPNPKYTPIAAEDVSVQEGYGYTGYSFCNHGSETVELLLVLEAVEPAERLTITAPVDAVEIISKQQHKDRKETRSGEDRRIIGTPGEWDKKD